MMRLARIKMTSLLSLLMVSSFAMASNDAVDGAKLVELRGCVTCHGKDGIGTDPSYPTLAGQYASYLEYSIKSYQNGTRKHELMKGYVKDLTDAEVETLARYFSKQNSNLHDLRGVK